MGGGATPARSGQEKAAMAEKEGGEAQIARQEFTLDRADSNSLRAALATSDPDRLDRFWHGIADQLRLDRDSILTGDIPQKGLIRFQAAVIPRVPDDPAFDRGPDDPALEEAGEPAGGQDGELAEGEAAGGGANAEAQMAGTERRTNEAADQLLDNARAATLAGDLAAGMLDIFEAMHKPWVQHSQAEKRERVAGMESLATKIIRGVVDIVASDGDRVAVKAIVDKITIGDKVAIGLKLGAMPHEEQGEAIAQLFDWQKASVLIVSADANGYLAKRGELIEPDEIELPFDPGDPSPQDIQSESPGSGAEQSPAADDADLADADEDEEDGGGDEELEGN
jgi:hypothetical protein